MGIRRDLNTIHVFGSPGPKDVFWIASAYHQAVVRGGFADVTLDFSECEIAFERFMLPVICLARSYLRDKNVSTSLVRPKDAKLRSLFHNANWEHLIAPTEFQETTFEGTQHVPAVQFFDPGGHHRAVDRVLDMVLASLPSLSRDSLKALKWSLDEIADNVINHAQSGIGGLLQASTFSERGCVEFVVADAGIGIPRSLGINRHKRAIEQAIKEGVTRNKATNRGNGLFGAFQIATLSGGSFEIISGHGFLTASGQKLRFGEEATLYPGTSVASRIDCAEPDLLSRALRFQGKAHDPAFDYIEQVYEQEQGDDLLFKMHGESASFGSREAAKAVATKLSNLLTMNPSCKVVLDFSDVVIISSSFADEVFGKLFVSMGPLNFVNRLEFRNTDQTIRGLIDRSIRQRASF